MNVMGVELRDIPEDFTPTDIVMVVKGMSSNGDMTLYKRSSSGLTDWEELGMLRAAAVFVEQGLITSYEEGE